MTVNVGDFFGKYGPIVTIVAGGLMAWGNLRTDVQSLKDSQPKLTQTREEVIEMRAEQKAIRGKIEEVDKKVEKVLDKLNEYPARNTRRPASAPVAGEDVSRD